LLETINKEAAKHNKVQDVLLQINTGKEEVKGGVNPEEALEAASAIQNYANVRLKGIMAVTPLDISVSERQKCFDTAYGIFAQLKQSYKGIEYLSMGMSNDYIQAIESGANMIRPGRAIFGERAY
jgi:pyridoxal phosphate enzyme (YggS family)